MQDKKQNDLATNDLNELARRILRYVEKHPQAKDTMKGIAEWWLLQDKITESVEQVSKTITWLVTNDYLVEKQVTGSGALYEINPHKHDAMMNLLTSPGDINS